MQCWLEVIRIRYVSDEVGNKYYLQLATVKCLSKVTKNSMTTTNKNRIINILEFDGRYPRRCTPRSKAYGTTVVILLYAWMRRFMDLLIVLFPGIALFFSQNSFQSEESFVWKYIPLFSYNMTFLFFRMTFLLFMIWAHFYGKISPNSIMESWIWWTRIDDNNTLWNKSMN